MIEQVVQAAREAGSLIEQVRAGGFEVEQKGRAGPVTEADRRADALLKQRLLALQPAGWLSEETADSNARLEERLLWCVDPLDGTKEFVKGLPEYTVGIALVDNGEPVLAVVHNPATGETFHAERSKGAFRADGSTMVRLKVQDSATLLVSRSEMKGGELAPFAAEWQLEPIGSIEYKLALVAAGRGAVTLSRGPKHEWDVCAGSLLVEEAGGIATDLFGEELQFNQPFPKTKGILAGSPEAYERARRLVAEVGASDRMREFR